MSDSELFRDTKSFAKPLVERAKDFKAFISVSVIPERLPVLRSAVASPPSFPVGVTSSNKFVQAFCRASMVGSQLDAGSAMWCGVRARHAKHHGVPQEFLDHVSDTAVPIFRPSTVLKY